MARGLLRRLRGRTSTVDHSSLIAGMARSVARATRTRTTNTETKGHLQQIIRGGTTTSQGRKNALFVAALKENAAKKR